MVTSSPSSSLLSVDSMLDDIDGVSHPSLRSRFSSDDPAIVMVTSFPSNSLLSVDSMLDDIDGVSHPSFRSPSSSSRF